MSPDVHATPGAVSAAVDASAAEAAGPAQDEGRLQGDMVSFGEDGDLLTPGMQDEQHVDIVSAVEQAIRESEREGPDRGGLVGGFDGEFVTPPNDPFERMDEESRARLREAERILREEGELPPGPVWARANPKKYSKNKPCVKGTPHMKWRRWQQAKPRFDGMALDIIKHCVHWELDRPMEADSREPQNGKLARENKEALADMILKDLRRGTYEVCQRSDLDVVLPFNLAPKPDGKPHPWRVCQRACVVNDALNDIRVRFEGYKTIPMVVSEGCWMFCIDLQSGYQQVLVSERVKRLQGGKLWMPKEHLLVLIEMGLIDWMEPHEVPEEGVEIYVRSGVMTFGNKRSVPLFTLLTRQQLRTWRTRGWRVGHLLDDFLFAVQGTYDDACAVRDQAVADLEGLGWLVNYEKSILTPDKIIKWVGVVIDSRLMRFFVPPEKVVNLEEQMRQFVVEGDETGCRELAVAAGKLSSMGVALIPVRMMLRELFKFIKPSAWEKEWEAVFPKTEEMKSSMKFWMRPQDGGQGNLRRWNLVGSPIMPDLRVEQIDLVVDAGTCVGYQINGVQSRLTREVSMPHRGCAGVHHVHREVDALVAVVQQEGPRRPNVRVLALVDARATSDSVRKGMSDSEEVHKKVQELWDATLKHGWTLRVEHIPGDEMVRCGVDDLSRLGEFTLAQRMFKLLVSKWGTPTLDWWASKKLAKLPRYCTRGGGDGSVGDARVVSISTEFVWAMPPITMIEYSLKRMWAEKARGILVVPLWRSQAYWSWRMRVRAEWVFPWSATNPVMKTSDGGAHRLNRYQFVAWLIDFTGDEALLLAKGPPVKVGKQAVTVDVGVPRRTQSAKTPKRRREEGLVVLSIFDGIGAGLLALHRAGFVVKEYWRIEVDVWCNLLMENAPEAKLCGDGDVTHIQGTEVGQAWPRWSDVDLILGGFPCQGVSRANIYGKGLLDPGPSGAGSVRFFDMMRVVSAVERVNARVLKLVECVARWNNPKHLEFATHTLQMQPKVVCSSRHSFCKRERNFWTSWWRRVQQIPAVAADANDILDAGRMAVDKDGRRVAKLATIVASGRSWNTVNPVWDEALQRYDDLRPHEMERAMEMPAGYTALAARGKRVPEQVRRHMVGNAFHVGTVAALLDMGRQMIQEQARMNTRGEQHQPP